MLVQLAMLMPASAVPPPPSPSPPPPSSTPPKGYTLFSHQKTWSEASAECLGRGMQLASVLSAAENEQLVRVVGHLPANTRLWIGGTDAASEGTWKWSPSGMPLSYTNWYYREPNNDWGNEHCLELVPRWSGKWNDLDCTANRKYVCETRPTRHIYMEWKFPAEHNVGCKDYHPHIGGGQEEVGGAGRGRQYKLATACDVSGNSPFSTYHTAIGYGVNGDDYVDFIFTFNDANTWCGGYRQFGNVAWGAPGFTKDIEVYTGDANFGPWTKVATDSHSKWHNWSPTFPDDGTSTEWTPTAPSKYLLVRTRTNHGETRHGGYLTVRFLQLKFAVLPK